MSELRPTLLIGTRGSPLALAQANEVRARLAAAHPDLAVKGAIGLQIIRTTGDAITDRPLAEIGGKGLFTKEIEEALLDGTIDLAVHSMKDVPTWLPDGLVIDCLLPREDPHDALFTTNGAGGLDRLSPGSVVGTSSLRRQAQILAIRPDLKVVPLRGNVETRLRRVREGAIDATILALAGLRRLGLANQVTQILTDTVMVPAVAQGAVGIERRQDDQRVAALLAPLHDPATAVAVTAERAMLATLEGSCRTPIAGLALLDGAGNLTLDGLVASPDGTRLHRLDRRGPATDPQGLGVAVGEALRQAAGAAIFATWSPEPAPQTR